MKKCNLLTLLLTCLLLSGSLCAETKVKVTGAVYTDIADDGFKKMHLRAAEAELFGKDIVMKGIVLQLFKKGKKTPMLINSPACLYDQDAKEIKSDSKISLVFDQGKIEGRGYDVFMGLNHVRIRNDVKATFKIKK
jgi:hypothetical protein